MPWCPKCKSEYRDGVTFCEDCKVDLVESLDGVVDLVEFAIFEEEKTAAKFVDYLSYSGIEAKTVYSEENDAQSVMINEKDIKKVKTHFKAFCIVEDELKKKEALLGAINASKTGDRSSKANTLDHTLENEDAEELDDEESFDWERGDNEDSDHQYGESEEVKESKDLLNELEKSDKKSKEDSDEEPLLEEMENNILHPESAVYVMKADQTKELKSTAITFLAFGILGILYLLLNIFGVISFTTGLLSYIIMGAVFIGFIVVALQSFTSSKKTAKEAVQEEELTTTLVKWMEQTITTETLNEIQNKYKSESEVKVAPEIMYLKLLFEIKQIVVKQFGEINDTYLETVIEEFYNDYFNDYLNQEDSQEDETE